MTTTAYCDNAAVKKRLSGDNPAMSGKWDAVITDITVQVSAQINRAVATQRGVDFPWSFIADAVATERLFTPAPGFPTYLPIDDCVAITQVRIFSTPTVQQQVLVANTDWVAKQGMPTIGLYRIGTNWPGGRIQSVGVTAKWGYGTAVPDDVIDCTITECIRELLAAQSGEDDKVGSHVFGTVVISKAFSQKTMSMIEDYSYGGAQFRG